MDLLNSLNTNNSYKLFDHVLPHLLHSTSTPQFIQNLNNSRTTFLIPIINLVHTTPHLPINPLRNHHTIPISFYL
jgi:hypothetical protein